MPCRPTNLTRTKSLDAQLGRASPQRAAPSADSSGGEVGGAVERSNASGTNIEDGDVVVLLDDGTIELADTARDTRIIGVATDDIDDGEAGSVVFWGPIDRINCTASVTAGHYAESTTTAGQATGNSTRRSGSFAMFTSGGTDTPSGFLFGVPDS